MTDEPGLRTAGAAAARPPPAAAVDALPGDADSYLVDAVGGQPLHTRLRSLWHHVTGGAAADGSGLWVAPAVVCTALALSGVAAFVVMRRRRRL